MPEPAAGLRPILVIEDDDDAREGLVRALETAGYRAVGVSSAIEALGMLRDGGRASMILLDLFLPGMSGWQFREEQVRDAELASIPVIVISGYPHTLDTIQRGRLRGAAAFSKPVDPDALFAAIEQHVRRLPLDCAARLAAVGDISAPVAGSWPSGAGEILPTNPLRDVGEDRSGDDSTSDPTGPQRQEVHPGEHRRDGGE
jgi:CheY-like chemotaxis protein